MISEGFIEGCAIGPIGMNWLAGWSAIYSTLGFIFVVVPWTLALPLGNGIIKLIAAEIRYRKGKDPDA